MTDWSVHSGLTESSQQTLRWEPDSPPDDDRRRPRGWGPPGARPSGRHRPVADLRGGDRRSRRRLHRAAVEPGLGRCAHAVAVRPGGVLRPDRLRPGVLGPGPGPGRPNLLAQAVP